MIGFIVCFRIDRRCNGVSCVANFGASVLVGVTRRGIVVDLFDASYTLDEILEIYEKPKQEKENESETEIPIE